MRRVWRDGIGGSAQRVHDGLRDPCAQFDGAFMPMATRQPRNPVHHLVRRKVSCRADQAQKFNVRAQCFAQALAHHAHVIRRHIQSHLIALRGAGNVGRDSRELSIPQPAAIQHLHGAAIAAFHAAEIFPMHVPIHLRAAVLVERAPAHAGLHAGDAHFKAALFQRFYGLGNGLHNSRGHLRAAGIGAERARIVLLVVQQLQKNV